MEGVRFFPPVLSCFDEVPVHKPVYDSVLTVKQEEVLALVRQGHSNKVIVHRLGLSEATVKLHARHIMQKFRIANRTQLAIAAINHISSPEAPITLRGSCARAGDTHTATPLRSAMNSRRLIVSLDHLVSSIFLPVVTCMRPSVDCGTDLARSK
jgi:DNA-binding CsgD family transcriptional regulator